MEEPFVVFGAVRSYRLNVAKEERRAELLLFPGVLSFNVLPAALLQWTFSHHGAQTVVSESVELLRDVSQC